MIQEMFQTPVGIFLISVIWGLGLSTLFRKACQGRTCQVIKYAGPDPNEVQAQYYNYGTPQCYQYVPVLSKCEINPPQV
jgi:hypothetical protein